MTDASTDSCVAAFINGWVSRFGLPDVVTSDRGTQFTSHLWQQLNRRLGTSAINTTAYNPEANGMVERFHRSLKAALMARCSSENWKRELPWVMLGLRTAPKDDDDHSPAERVYGDQLTVPADFFRPTQDLSPSQLQEAVQRFIPCRQTYHPARQTHLPASLMTATHVFVRTDAVKPPLTQPYTGPYKVHERKDKAFRVKVRNSLEWVSIDRLKPAYLLSDDQPDITFSRAGRPIRACHLSLGGEYCTGSGIAPHETHVASPTPVFPR